MPHRLSLLQGDGSPQPADHLRKQGAVRRSGGGCRRGNGGMSFVVPCGAPRAVQGPWGQTVLLGAANPGASRPPQAHGAASSELSPPLSHTERGTNGLTSAAKGSNSPSCTPGHPMSLAGSPWPAPHGMRLQRPDAPRVPARWHGAGGQDLGLRTPTSAPSAAWMYLPQAQTLSVPRLPRPPARGQLAGDDAGALSLAYDVAHDL